MKKRLTRPLDKKSIAGVCAGLADYFDIDIILMRLIFVLVALITAIVPVCIFYLIAWLIIPPSNSNDVSSSTEQK